MVSDFYESNRLAVEREIRDQIAATMERVRQRRLTGSLGQPTCLSDHENPRGRCPGCGAEV